ncbi:MAG: helicase C-terminal domain-containing protein [Thermoprotei archaeon]
MKSLIELEIDQLYTSLPYTLTKTQIRILDVIFRTRERHIYSLIEAANGVGKTTCIATAAALLAKQGVRSAIFCMTYKQISRVINELKRIGTAARSVVVGSHDAFCCSDNFASPRTICRIRSMRGACAYGRPSADYSPWLLDVDELVRDARTRGVCAYEAAWQSADNAQIVLATQAYLLYDNSWKKISRFVDNRFLLVDECHNLIHSGVSVFSFSLDFKSSACKRIREIVVAKTRWSKGTLLARLGDVENFIADVYQEILSLLDSKNNHLAWKVINEYNLIKLLWEATYDRLFVRENQCEGYLGYPEEHLNRRFKAFSGGVLVSATPGSIETYKRIVYDAPLYVEKLPAPYTKDQLKIFILNDFSTKYTERTTQNYVKACDRILRLWEKTRNLGVYLPSYEYLNKIASTIFEKHPEIAFISQSPSLVEFRYHENRAVLSVQGGREGEGSEIPGGLDVVLVVGLALPFPKSLLVAREKMYRGLGISNPGEPAYISWATQKAVQAIGRVIRGPSDKGVGILMDRRFQYHYVVRSFPTWFQSYILRSIGFEELIKLLGE